MRRLLADTQPSEVRQCGSVPLQVFSLRPLAQVAVSAPPHCGLLLWACRASTRHGARTQVAQLRTRLSRDGHSHAQQR